MTQVVKGFDPLRQAPVFFVAANGVPCTQRYYGEAGRILAEAAKAILCEGRRRS